MQEAVRSRLKFYIRTASSEQPRGCGSDAETVLGLARRSGGNEGYCFTDLKKDNMLNLDTQIISQGGNLATAFRFLLPHRKLPTVMQPLKQVRLWKYHFICISPMKDISYFVFVLFFESSSKHRGSSPWPWNEKAGWWWGRHVPEKFPPNASQLCFSHGHQKMTLWVQHSRGWGMAFVPLAEGPCGLKRPLWGYRQPRPFLGLEGLGASAFQSTLGTLGWEALFWPTRNLGYRQAVPRTKTNGYK